MDVASSCSFSRAAWAVLVGAGLLLLVASILFPRPEHAAVSPAYAEEFSNHSGPAGFPERFQQFHQEIRAGTNGIPYPVNYKMDELARAVRARKRPGSRLPWKERGPANVGGRTRAVALDPSDTTHATWYAGAVSGGLWKTANAGKSWRALTDDLPNLSVSSLAIPPSSPSVVYMGTGEGFGNLDAVAGSGVFKSMDSGQTWEQLARTATDENFRFVNRLAVDPDHADLVMAATNTGIFRSEDGGETWVQVYRAAGRVQDLKAQPGNFDLLLATENGTAILRSEDKGQTWTRALEDFPNGGARIELAFSLSHPAVVWAAIQISSASSDLIRSIDGGQTWSWTLPIAPNWMGAQGWYDNTLAVHPFAPDTVLLGGIELWLATLGTDTGEVAGPSRADFGLTRDFMEFVSFDLGTHLGRRLALGTLLSALDATEADYVPIEIRFGQGSQKAHRFTVAPDGGTAGDGGAGIPLAQYEYAGYVDVPLQVWDTESNRQLMFSFRDQADNGKWDLIRRSVAEGTPRDLQSREYIFVHRYDYSDTTPHPSVAVDGGVRYGMLYFMWPHLAAEAVWRPDDLPHTALSIHYARVPAQQRIVHSYGTGAHVDHHALVPIPIDASSREFWVLNSNDGGVALSRDGGRRYLEADKPQAGYNTAQFYGIAKRPGRDMYIGGLQDNGTWRSYDDPSRGSAWNYQLGGDGFDALWHPNDDRLILGSLQFNHVRRSQNGGGSWAPAVSGLGDVGYSRGGQFLTQLSNSPYAPDRVFTIGRSGVWKSENFGASWSLSPITSQWSFGDTGRIRASLASENVVWAGYAMEQDPPVSLHISRNAGLSFEQTVIPENAPNARLSGLATHPDQEGTAFALFSARNRPKVMRTTDYGHTWVDLSGFPNESHDVSTNGFPNVAVYDLLVLPHAPEVLWAGTEIGIFQSRDHGAGWEYADNGLPAVAVWRMRVRDDQIVVATHGRGVWTVPAGSVRTSAGAADAALPATIQLDQNYPNPFNASTTVPFQLPRQAFVTIAIYDAAGRRIATLTDQQYPVGRHELRWIAGAEASGVYFCRMESDGRLVETRRMVLVK